MEKLNKQQWSTEETSYLLGIWSSEEVQRKLEGSTRSKAIIQQLQKEMATAGFYRTVEQIGNKFKKVKKDYREQKRDLGRSGSGRPKRIPHYDLLDSVLGDRPTSGFGSTVNSLSLMSMLQDESLSVQSSFDAEISGLECTVSESPLPSACSSPMKSLLFPQAARPRNLWKRDLSSGLLEKSEDRLQEQGQAMLQEVHVANAEFLRVFTRIEQNSHSMLGMVDRLMKVMEANNES
ncbi:zinc finger and SCAN domain-containing protein 29-like [Pseudochaenichthys georgianus]|uniref:zinc finger and SCAN domain-containing protein 29-like n=1 Tax=Pseudochaenichthys georgianus TaxID=52239 RepID=UPI0039C4B402